MPECPDIDAIFTQFARLMGELLDGSLRRGRFQSWEIDILLDIQSCSLHGSAQRQVLREYQKAVQAGLQEGERLPMRLSEYLKRREESRQLNPSRVKKLERAMSNSKPSGGKAGPRQTPSSLNPRSPDG